MNIISNSIKANRYGIVIFCILLFFILSNSKDSIDQDVLCSYVIDYKTGYGGRKLIATIINVIFGAPGIGKIRACIFAISTIFCAIFAWLCNRFIISMKKRNESAYFTSLYTVALYLVCPASLMFLLRYPNLGRPDFYLYAICLIFSILFYNRNKNRVLYFCFVAILMIIAILTHHVFVASYMSFFVALFIYDIWSEGFNKKIFAYHVVLGITTAAVFLSILMFSSMNLKLDEATHYNPNIDLNRKFVCFVYFANITDNIELYVIPKLPRLIAGFLLTVLFLSPLYYAIWKIWKDTYKSLKNSASKKLLIGIQSAFLLFIPAFCITVDYPRWFGASLFLQFLLLAYFAYDKSSLYNGIGEIIFANLKKYTFFAIFLLVYCSLLEYFYSDTYFRIVELIMEKMHIYRVTTLLPLEYRI